MKCETCQGRGFIEYEHGLLMVECGVCNGTGEVEDVLTIEESCTYTGLYFQLLGKRNDDYSIKELWKMALEASLEKMEFPYIVDMPCGKTMWFSNQSSILNLPIDNIPCPCGNPNHYIVKFVDGREENGISTRDRQFHSNAGTANPRKPRKRKVSKKA